MSNDFSEKFEKMRIAGKLASKTLDMLLILLNQVYLQMKLISLVMSLLKIMVVTLLHFIIEVLINLYVHH